MKGSVNRLIGESRRRTLHQQLIYAPVRLQLRQRLHLEFGERTDLADRQIAKLDGTEPHTHESVHLEAQRLAETAHFTILSLGDGDRQFPPQPAELLRLELLRSYDTVLELNPAVGLLRRAVGVADHRGDV